MIRRVINILYRIFQGIVILLILCFALFHLSFVQSKIVGYVVNMVKEKTGAEVSIRKIYLSFPKNLTIRDLLIQDERPDTLAFIHRADINVSLIGLLQNKIHIREAEINGLIAEVYRRPHEKDFNYQFIIDGFSGNTPKQKDTTGSSWEFELGIIKLADNRADYLDSLNQQFHQLKLGELELRTDNFDLENGDFGVPVLKLKDTHYSFISNSTQDTIEMDDETAGIPFVISNELIELENVSFTFQDANRISMDISVGNLEAKPEKLDLNKQEILINSFLLDHPQVKISTSNPDTTAIKPEPKQFAINNANTIFGEIGWTVATQEIEIEKGLFAMHNRSLPESDLFDPNHLQFEEINMISENTFFSDSLIRANISKLEAVGSEKMHLQEFLVDFSMMPSEIKADNFRLKTNRTNLSGKLGMQFPSINQIGDNPSELNMLVDLEPGIIALSEVLYFIPQFEGREKLSSLSNLNPEISVHVSGKLNNLDIRKFRLNIPEKLTADLQATISGLPDMNRLGYSLNLKELKGDDFFLSHFVEDTSIQKMIPKTWSVHGKLDGTTKQFDSDLAMHTSFGNLYGKGIVNFDKLNSQTTRFNLTGEKVAVGKIIGSSKIETADFHFDLISNNLSDLKGQLSGVIDKVIFNCYEYRNLQVQIDSDERIEFKLASEDPNVNLQIAGNAMMQDSSYHVNYNFDIENLDLLATELAKKNYRIHTVISGEYDIDPDEFFKGETEISDLIITVDSVQHTFESVKISSLVQKDNIDFKLNSEVVTGYLKGNADIKDIGDIINNKIQSFVGTPDSTLDFSDKSIDFELNFLQEDLVTTLLVQNLESIKIDEFTGHYDGRKDEFSGNIKISEIRYGNLGLDSVSLNAMADADTMYADLFIEQFLMDTLAIRQLNFGAYFQEDTISTTFQKFDSAMNPQYFVRNKIKLSKGDLYVIFPNEQITWNSQHWKRNDVQVLDLKDSIKNNVSYSNGSQKINFISSLKQLSISFDQFNLSNYINFFELSDSIPLLAGVLNGEVMLRTSSSFPFEVDLQLNDLYFLENELGNINLIADKDEAGLFHFGIASQYKQNLLRLRGDYKSLANDYQYHADLLVNWKDLDYFEPFLDNTIDFSGEIIGEARFSGTREAIRADGKINFNDVRLSYAELNTSYTVNSGLLEFADDQLLVKDFRIHDQNSNPLNASGKINYAQLNNLTYDLKLSSQNFLIMNNSSKENEKVYGKLLLTSNIDLHGTSSKPILRSDLKLESGTNMTYVMPGQSLELVTDQGVVVWNDDKITEVSTGVFESDSINKFMEDYQLTVNLEIDKNVSFTLITDPNSGDIAQCNLNGKLVYKQESGKDPNLTGVIETEKGFYELSFYGLVKKRFTVTPGSRIGWSGDIMDGIIDIEARYETKTNSAALMANEGMVGNQYNQRLDYFVVLDIGGMLKNPELKFLLDLKEEYKRSYSIIANKLQQLNMPENEVERNKQVFALLVTGGFIADSPVAGSGASSNNFATSAARNSVNGILTQQLNNITGQYIKFVDFNVGVNTYENYSTGHSETKTDLDLQVSKKLFNDRVTVEVESSINIDNNSTQNAAKPGKTTNFEYAVLYDLTESGNYKVKAFRENAYDLFDGEIQNSGVAFIFMRDFNPKSMRESEGVQDSTSQDALRPEEDEIKEENEE